MDEFAHATTKIPDLPQARLRESDASAMPGAADRDVAGELRALIRLHRPAACW
jgi:hypothetical protein